MISFKRQWNVDCRMPSSWSGAFKRETGVRGNCHLTFVTTYGLRRNSHSGMVQSEVTLDDLFRDVT